MAGFLNFINLNTGIVDQSVATPSGTNITGVWFDGFYFWVANTTSVLQCHIAPDGVMYQDGIVRVSTTAPDYSGPVFGVCGDDTFLYVSYEAVVISGMAATNENRVAQYDKTNSKFISLVSNMTTSSSLIDSHRDLTLNGRTITTIRRTTSIPIRYAYRTHYLNFPPDGEFITSGSTTFELGGIVHAGDYFYIAESAATGRIYKYNYSGTQIATVGAVGSAITGLDFGRSIHYESQWFSQHYKNTFNNVLDGEWVVAATN